MATSKLMARWAGPPAGEVDFRTGCGAAVAMVGRPQGCRMPFLPEPGRRGGPSPPGAPAGPPRWLGEGYGSLEGRFFWWGLERLGSELLRGHRGCQ